MNLLKVLWIAYRAYRQAGEQGSGYCAITLHGIPQFACFIGTGREAWRISVRAFEEFELKERG